MFRYAATTKNYTAFYASGGRDPLLNNNANTYFNISTFITLNMYVTNARGTSVLNTRYVLCTLIKLGNVFNYVFFVLF